MSETTGAPFLWVVAALALGLVYYVAWRQYRESRPHRRDYRQRERQRREYWGWE